MKMDIQKIDISPSQLDAQSPIHIDEWVALDSDKHKETDDMYHGSKFYLIQCSQNGFLKVDSFGRCWCHGPDQEMLPYFYEHGDKNYGLRVPAIAAN